MITPRSFSVDGRKHISIDEGFSLDFDDEFRSVTITDDTRDEKRAVLFDTWGEVNKFRCKLKGETLEIAFYSNMITVPMISVDRGIG